MTETQLLTQGQHVIKSLYDSGGSAQFSRLNTHTALYSLSLSNRMKEKGQRTVVRKLRDQNKDRQLTNRVVLYENQT